MTSRVIEVLYVIAGIIAVNLTLFHFAHVVDLSLMFFLSLYLSALVASLWFVFPIAYLVVAPFALRKLKREHEHQKWRTVFTCSAVVLVFLGVELTVVLKLVGGHR